MAKFPDVIYLEQDFNGKLRQASMGHGAPYYSVHYLEDSVSRAETQANERVESFISALRELLQQV